MSDTKLKKLNILIDQFPKFQLGDFPTPLYKCKNIEKSLGIKHFYIKRDDLSGLAFGGNKVRHLEFRIGDVINENCDIFINSNVKVSNNSRSRETWLSNRRTPSLERIEMLLNLGKICFWVSDI